ncbi:MAG TPA: hypothetical protein VNC42_16045 [Bradyrhizobium sp.]|nr:hypothetical protein [Bradyrhizobium sp.]
MLAFALACRGGQLSGVRGLGARLGDFHIHLMDASSRDVSEREGRIFGDGAVESLAGPVPGRKNTIDTIAVKCRGAVRYRRQPLIVSVMVHLAFPPNGANLYCTMKSPDCRGPADNIVAQGCVAVEPVSIPR